MGQRLVAKLVRNAGALVGQVLPRVGTRLGVASTLLKEIIDGLFSVDLFQAPLADEAGRWLGNLAQRRRSASFELDGVLGRPEALLVQFCLVLDCALRLSFLAKANVPQRARHVPGRTELRLARGVVDVIAPTSLGPRRCDAGSPLLSNRALV